MSEFLDQETEALRRKIQFSETGYYLDAVDEATDEYVHFYFIGKHDGKEVIFDCILYTLRFHYESELMELVEKRVMEKFPEYKTMINNNEDVQTEREEEIGMYMAEVILELEEDEAIKVTEHVDLDTTHPVGIGLDVGLQLEKITSETLDKFIKDFNSDTLELDETLYSFSTATED